VCVGGGGEERCKSISEWKVKEPAGGEEGIHRGEELQKHQWVEGPAAWRGGGDEGEGCNSNRKWKG
jgi:hypothetical protein